MAPGISVKSAQDFFKKYHLQADLSAPAPTVPLWKALASGALKEEYQHLDPAERYAVFVRLLRGGQVAVLRRVTGYQLFSVARVSERLRYIEGWFRFHDKMSDKERWTRRVKGREELFFLAEDLEHYAQLVAGLEPRGRRLSVKELMALRERVAESLKQTYERSRTPVWFVPGSPLWDTDDDLDPYAPRQEWDAAFDDVDRLPLDPNCKLDRDRDGVCDTYDADPTRPDRWIDIPVGRSMTRDLSSGGKLIIQRTAPNKIVLRIELRIGAAPGEDEASLRKRYLNVTYLTRLQYLVGKAFDRRVQKGPVHFSLDLSLKEDPSGGANIHLTTRPVRGHALLWSPGILEDEDAVLHELFHLIGFEDYYHEPLTQRDYTLKPGVRVLGFNDLMQDHSQSYNPISAIKVDYVDMISMVAKRAAGAKPQPAGAGLSYALPNGHTLTPHGFRRRDGTYAVGLTGLLHAFKAHRDDPRFIPVFLAACDTMMMSPEALGFAALHHPELADALRYIYEHYDSMHEGAMHYAPVLSEQGKHDEAIKVYRRALAHNPYQPDMLERLSEELRSAGKMREAAEAVRQSGLESIRKGGLTPEPLAQQARWLLAHDQGDRGLDVLEHCDELFSYLEQRGLHAMTRAEAYAQMVERLLDDPEVAKGAGAALERRAKARLIRKGSLLDALRARLSQKLP
jgi:Tetratricopeptide repeat